MVNRWTANTVPSPRGGYEWLASCSLANTSSLENTLSPQESGATAGAQAAALTPVHRLLSIHELVAFQRSAVSGCVHETVLPQVPDGLGQS